MTCKDCLPGSKRVALFPGPRCTTHHRMVRKQRERNVHEQRVQKLYGLSPGEYAERYAAQGGVCAICGPFTGRNGSTKRLAVDHDHATGRVRGLLCSDCNKLIGRWGDNPVVFDRAAAYLRAIGSRGAATGAHVHNPACCPFVDQINPQPGSCLSGYPL